jgi:uncharacterized repeat protein (TIGR01451 family)
MFRGARLRCPHQKTSRWSHVVPGIAVLAALLAAPFPAAAQILIDSFSTNQSALTLTYPPAGTTASSSVSGAGILGGERDLSINLTGGVIAGNTMSATVSSGFYSYSQDATIAGTGTIQWDGADGSATLNPTGLGGVDLTMGGTQDAILIGTFFDDLPVNLVIEVFTDAGNASTATVALPGLIFSSTNFAFPYSSFTTTLGAGADFTNVGAIVLSAGSAMTAPDLVLDFVQTTALINATKTVALVNDVNVNGMADPGDTLRYTVVITNPTDGVGASATGVMYSNPTPANTTLQTGTVTTTQGTVTTGNTGGDTSVAVNVGTIADGGTTTITFDVKINNPLPAGVTQITCQGIVTTSTLPTGVLTDDPTPPGGTDPTVEPVTAAPAVTATKVGALFTDVNGDGQIGPGDTIQYTVVITNAGNQDASGVVFTSGAPANTALVVGSVTTTAGTVTTGNTAGNTSVAVNVGTVPGGGGTVTITFKVTVNNPLPVGVTQITCQGTVTGTNIPTTPTDNPATPAPNDPTVLPVVQPAIAQVPTLNEWGLLTLIFTLLGLGMLKLRRRTA